MNRLTTGRYCYILLTKIAKQREITLWLFKSPLEISNNRQKKWKEKRSPQHSTIIQQQSFNISSRPFLDASDKFVKNADKSACFYNTVNKIRTHTNYTYFNTLYLFSVRKPKYQHMEDKNLDWTNSQALQIYPKKNYN